jgi:hypothetical protein
MLEAEKEIMELDEKMFKMLENIAVGFIVIESVIVRSKRSWTTCLQSREVLLGGRCSRLREGQGFHILGPVKTRACRCHAHQYRARRGCSR